MKITGKKIKFWESKKNRTISDLQIQNKQLNYEIDLAINLIENFSNPEKYKILESEATQKNSRIFYTLDNFKKKYDQMSRIEMEQNWINNGLAKFAEIMRVDDKDEELLFNQIVAELIKYINANQGGIFLLNENNALELKACFAYNRQKHLHKTIEIGEGLLGQCFLEGETTILTDIPDQYTTITSGLGESTPNCILLVPIKTDKQIVGVLEIASFGIIEKFQVNFVEKLSESIAFVTQQSKTNQKMRQLLLEAKLSNEQFLQQEEEIRQSFEELMATQEEVQRREAETKLQFENLKIEYANKVEDALKKSEDLKKHKEALIKHVKIDNVLIDVAGRNRMLSQKIAFLCEMIVAGKKDHCHELKNTIDLFDSSILCIKNGGQPKGLNFECNFEPADELIIPSITKVEELWKSFKTSATAIANLEQELKNHLETIELLGLSLLSLNNDLVNKCIELNQKKLLSSGIINHY